METNIETLVAEKNWKGLVYSYSEVTEETRMQYAYCFGKALLMENAALSLAPEKLAAKLVEAFRVAFYDKRMAEEIKGILKNRLYGMLEVLDRRAWEYTSQAANDTVKGAEYSRLGFEHYLLIYFLHPEEKHARRYLSKAKVFLVETHVAVLINKNCHVKCLWEQLDQLLITLKVLDPHFVEAIIMFLRLYNAVECQRKLDQCAYIAHLSEKQEVFSDEDMKRIKGFHNELQKEYMEILMEVLTGQQGYKQKLHESKIQRADEVKQFAIRYADCPDDLEHGYFKETLVHKKAADLLSKSKADEAFDLIRQEYATGIPKKTFLIRDQFNTIVSLLFEKTGDMAYVVQALKIDPDNGKLKEYLIQ